MRIEIYIYDYAINLNLIVKFILNVSKFSNTLARNLKNLFGTNLLT